MSKKLTFLSSAFHLLTATMLMAVPVESQVEVPVSDHQKIQVPSSRADCAMQKAAGYGTYFCDSIEAGEGFFTYFDPSIDCAEILTYPFEITGLTTFLYDFAHVGTVTIDIVVYDINPATGYPDAENCRMTVTETTLDNYVTYSFPTPCCVDSPFYIGVEYPNADGMTTPSIVMDEELNYDATHVVHLKSGGWMDWIGYFYDPETMPGDPFYFVEGQTMSVNCGVPCDCIPGDANNDGAVNVGDAVYIIAYVFKGGPKPVPYRVCSGDANCDCQCNVGDAVFVISYVFKGGPPPCDCPTWMSICASR